MTDYFSCFQLYNLTTLKIVKFEKPESFHANRVSHQMWFEEGFSNGSGKHISHLGESKMSKTIGFRSKMRSFEVEDLQKAQLQNFKDLRREQPKVSQTVKAQFRPARCWDVRVRSNQRSRPSSSIFRYRLESPILSRLAASRLSGHCRKTR